jgi:hypothetical protein
MILDARAGSFCRGAMVYREDEERSSSGPAGGGYGDVRARIDNDKLNAYLANNVPALAVPVTIKQFKVRFVGIFKLLRQGLTTFLTVWPG